MSNAPRCWHEAIAMISEQKAKTSLILIASFFSSQQTTFFFIFVKPPTRVAMGIFLHGLTYPTSLQNLLYFFPFIPGTKDTFKRTRTASELPIILDSTNAHHVTMLDPRVCALEMCNSDHNNLMERDPWSGSVQLTRGGHLATLFWQNANKRCVTVITTT
jgi:hypothetical protein